MKPHEASTILISHKFSKLVINFLPTANFLSACSSYQACFIENILTHYYKRRVIEFKILRLAWPSLICSINFTSISIFIYKLVEYSNKKGIKRE